MVRLKDKIKKSEVIKDFDFNSSMVRLKARPDGKRVGVFYYFNSSMVRLKERSIIQEFDVIIFQFQYGAIESSLP